MIFIQQAHFITKRKQRHLQAHFMQIRELIQNKMFILFNFCFHLRKFHNKNKEGTLGLKDSSLGIQNTFVYAVKIDDMLQSDELHK